MKNKGILIGLREKIRFKGLKARGQIATLIVLLVAVIALLAAIFLNIARVANKRLSVINASTAATLQLASSLGSYAHMLSCRFLDCKDKKCTFSWLDLVMFIVAVVLTVGAVLYGGVLLTTLAAVAIVSMVLQFTVFEPRMFEAMNRAFRKMEPKVQLCEQAIQTAFMNTVDDTARVADIHDFDMDGKYGFDESGSPRDLLNRFNYKYTQRLLWLAESGPGPDGKVRDYKNQLEALIEEFIPYLQDFNDQAQELSDYIGSLPRENSPQLPAPSDPQDIDSLYALFAYLQENEYPTTNNPMYNLSEPENIWTRGVVECSDEYDENPDDPCQHSPENDEIDSLFYDLNGFNNPQGGFAPAILGASAEERYLTFETWYNNLYSECADEPPPEEGQPCQNPDYQDYYDLIWQIPDEPETEYLVEKGWRQAIADWLNRLNQIATDISARISRLRCGEDDEACIRERERLEELLNKVNEARTNLGNFQKGIPTFREAIYQLHEKYEQLEDKDEDIDPTNEDALLYIKRAPTYVWTDSLGKHTVKVEVSDFQLAYLKAYKSGWFRRCIKLENKSGTVWVKVTRTDESTEAKFPGPAGEIFWRFRYPRLSYTASAYYSYEAAPPEFLGIRKDE